MKSSQHRGDPNGADLPQKDAIGLKRGTAPSILVLCFVYGEAGWGRQDECRAG